MEIAKSWAHSFRNYIQSYYEGLLLQISTQIKENKKTAGNLEKDYKEDEEYLKLLTDRHRRNPRSFSKSLGIIYLTFAVLLVFADFPLALKLTQVGFDLDIGRDMAAIQKLFYNPWLVFKENWEVFILAFGIALCTVYIKIFYDEFLGSPMERAITQFRKLRGVKYPKDEKLIKKIKHRRFAFKLCVLILTLGTIFMLGIFRFKTIDYQNELKKITASRYRNMTTSDQIFNRNNSAQNDIIALNESLEKNRKLVTQIAFIAITILFPVIGGICFSLGMNAIENSRDYKRTKKFCEESKRKYINASKDYDESIRRKRNWDSALNWCKEDDFIDHHLKYFISYYEHGYEKGLVEPLNLDEGKDLFDKVEQWRNKITSYEIIEEIRQAKSLSSDINFSELLLDGINLNVKKLTK